MESLQAVRNNSLVENYEPHDILQEYYETRMESMDFAIEQWGMDDRHAKDVTEGYGPDIACYKDLDARGFIEFKAKRLSSSGDDWFGCLNKRHLKEYANHDSEHDVPTAIVFGVVDMDRGAIVREAVFFVDEMEFVFPQDDWDEKADDVDHYRYSQGNPVACLDLDNGRNFQHLLYRFDQ